MSAGAAFRDDRPGVELDGVGGRRVVLPDGLRDVPRGQRNFRLPGLGSYLQTAASSGDYAAMTWGLITMVLIIVMTDQLMWRPLIAWSDKFKFENVESGEPGDIADPCTCCGTRTCWRSAEHTLVPLGESIYRSLARREEPDRRRSSRR